jgi:hypothetical protein
LIALISTGNCIRDCCILVTVSLSKNTGTLGKTIEWRNPRKRINETYTSHEEASVEIQKTRLEQLECRWEWNSNRVALAKESRLRFDA